ncbi:hypothetical protein [Actinoalloteichus caeruleus]|uniref:hypothetical protein n=1 Tax=Actinoalloteichus cyanogriseus TaxID=2893586 RepID=UPI003BB8A1EE
MDSPIRAHQVWRALTYLSVAQLYLRDNVLAARPLRGEDVKSRPVGHWGTVPSVAWALAGLATQATPVRPVIGAGHAGIVQRSYAWLTGDLHQLRPQYDRNRAGLAALCADFPACDGLGAEVHPELPAGGYVGGQLGPALAFAQAAAAAGDGESVVVPIIGDGEAETGETAAAWLADPVIRPDPAHAPLLPILNLNGLRMGSTSLLGSRPAREVDAYLRGTGWRTRWAHVSSASPGEADQFTHLLRQALNSVRDGDRLVLVLDMPKGLSGPAAATPACHKTPLPDPAGDPRQRAELAKWMSSYRPRELFTGGGAPAIDLRTLPTWPPAPPPRPIPTSPRQSVPTPSAGWSLAAEIVLRAHAPRGLRVFCPDELASNRLAALADEPWTSEVLNEPVCSAWLHGHTAAGRPGVLATYEAFAPLIAGSLSQHAKTLRLLTDRDRRPSVNVLVTSLGWHNCYTHGDPSLVTTLLGLADPAVRIYTPADFRRAAVQLDGMLASTGAINVLVVDKHLPACGPAETIEQEIAQGWAIWHEPPYPPPVVLISVGDLAAHQLHRVREELGLPARHVHVHEPAVLGDPADWPQAITPVRWRQVFPPGVPMLVATTGQPAALWPLLGPRGHRPLVVRGWREPAAPLDTQGLLRTAGLDLDSLRASVVELMDTVREAMC